MSRKTCTPNLRSVGVELRREPYVVGPSWVGTGDSFRRVPWSTTTKLEVLIVSSNSGVVVNRYVIVGFSDRSLRSRGTLCLSLRLSYLRQKERRVPPYR